MLGSVPAILGVDKLGAILSQVAHDTGQRMVFQNPKRGPDKVGLAASSGGWG